MSEQKRERNKKADKKKKNTLLAATPEPSTPAAKKQPRKIADPAKESKTTRTPAPPASARKPAQKKTKTAPPPNAPSLAASAARNTAQQTAQQTEPVLSALPVTREEGKEEGKEGTHIPFASTQPEHSPETLKHQQDKARLVLLAAAGQIQTHGVNDTQVKQLIQLARELGASKEQVSQMLLAGVHDSLGRAIAASGNQTLALKHFENSATMGAQDVDARLSATQRMHEQLKQLGLKSSSSAAKPNFALAEHLYTLNLLYPASQVVHIGLGQSGNQSSHQSTNATWYQHWPQTPSVHRIAVDPQWHQQQTALDTLLPTPLTGQWLIVESQEAVQILQGAQQHVLNSAVIVVRTNKQNREVPHHQGSDVVKLEKLLQPIGYILFACVEEESLACEQILFVRNYPKLLQEEQTQHQGVKNALHTAQQNEVSKDFLNDLHKKQAEEITRVRNYLGSSLKREVANATKQIEAFVGLQSYLATGELPSLNVERHKWPVSPDFAFYLAELLEGNRYHLVIEFGSGQSTTLMARIMQKIARRDPDCNKPPTVLVSFDHLAQFYQQTRLQLQQAGLLPQVQLHHTPLVDWQDPDGGVQPYYDCQAILTQLSAQYPDKTQLRILLVVDGPPGDTCKHARYPAGPIILKHFKGAQIDILLDDYIRVDEKEVAQRWKGEITAAQLSCDFQERLLEKDACLLRIYP